MGERIAWSWCGAPSWKNTTRAFVLAGKAGQPIDLYADGLLERGAPDKLNGLDTKVSVYLGKKLIASNDNTPTPGWILRLNKAPNKHSSSINSFVLPSDGQYLIVVTVKAQRQGSVELVVKTPDVDVCATFQDYDEATGTTYFGAKNFNSEAEGLAWIDQVSPQADIKKVLSGACNEGLSCSDEVNPVCAQTGQGTNLEFSNECSFRAAVLADAGDEFPSESKGKYVMGECPVQLCAAVQSKGPEDQDTYYYVRNVATDNDAQVWFQNFPYALSTTILDGPCDQPTTCQLVYDPVCGQVLYDPPATFSNKCAFFAAVRKGAGHEIPNENKGFYGPGTCE